MKAAALFLLAIMTFSHSIYVEPPINEVDNHNKEAAKTLLNFTKPEFIGVENCQLVENPSDIAGITIDFVAIKAVALTPSIDSNVSAEYAPELIWTYGEKHKNSVSWEKDGCTSTAAYNNFSQQTNATFQFLNHTEQVQLANNPIELPSQITQWLNSTQANSMLTVNLTGTAVFTYSITAFTNSCENKFCTCVQNPQASGEKNIMFLCNNTLNYSVDGGNIVRLLERPVLKEQWSKNNHFDNLLATNRRIYTGELLLNNQTFANFSLYQFNISEDSYGIQEINAIPAVNQMNTSVYEASETSNPLQLEEENDSFSHIYEINSSYDGIGWNNLTISIKSQFGKKIEFTDEIDSRELSSSGNLTENNQTGSKNIRPSFTIGEQEYKTLVISSGALGLLLVVALLKLKN